MQAPLLDAVSELPATPEVVALTPSQRVRPDGEVVEVQHGASLRARVRPDAPIQVALTGHYDTVFPAAHAFQAPWRDGDMLRGPGVADMKGGINVMLAGHYATEVVGVRALMDHVASRLGLKCLFLDHPTGL